MKIKTHRYLEELRKAEQRGYERGRQEGERHAWDIERAERKEHDDMRFRDCIIERIDAIERQVEELSQPEKVARVLEEMKGKVAP